MTSVERGAKQVSVDNEYFIPVASLSGLVLSQASAGAALSSVSWAFFGSRYFSSVNGAGAGLLKDMGRNLISGGRTFRRVQLVVPQSTGTVSTFGVNGNVGTATGIDYLTGYIEVGFDAASGTAPVPVAKWGR